MKIKSLFILILIIFIGFLQTSCLKVPTDDSEINVEKNTKKNIEEDTIKEEGSETKVKETLISIDLKRLGGEIKDNNDIYLQNKKGYKTLYITIQEPDKDNIYTLNDINNDINYRDDIRPEVKVLLQEGDESGIKTGMFGYSLKDGNALLRIRGHSTRNASLKSYKIIIDTDAGSWEGQKILNLNKHPYDLTKVRNKLAFDLLAQISNITSLRTQFLHVYIKDLSKEIKDKDFIDYGLFTHVEQPDEDFLKAHGLDTEGALYKAEFFEFLRYGDNIKTKDDPDYDKKEFEKILEMKNNNDNEKLISMLDDVNNYDIDINDIIKKHFNLDNYLTWLAINILFENTDTNSQNFYLYSPKDFDTWYFMPWDYDGSLGYYEQVTGTSSRASWKYGLTNYWGVTLHRRFIKESGKIDLLTQKIEELYLLLNKDIIKKYLDEYYNDIVEFIYNEPDTSYLPSSTENFEIEYIDMINVLDENKDKYYKNIQFPMPVFSGTPEKIEENGTIKWRFFWNDSYDIQGQDIMYDMYIGLTEDLEDPIITLENLKESSTVVSDLAAGEYFWKLIIKDSDGNKQVQFATFSDENGKEYHGTQKITLK